METENATEDNLILFSQTYMKSPAREPDKNKSVDHFPKKQLKIRIRNLPSKIISPIRPKFFGNQLLASIKASQQLEERRQLHWPRSVGGAKRGRGWRARVRALGGRKGGRRLLSFLLSPREILGFSFLLVH